MSATDPTRIEVAESLIHHSALHQLRFWDELSKLPELTAAPLGEAMERGLFWNFEFKHAIEDLRSALEYGAYDAYERFVCTNHQLGSVHTHVSFPVAKDQTEFQKKLTPTKDYPGWKFRGRGAQITKVFLSAQPFSAAGDKWLSQLHDVWNEGKHRNPSYFSARIRLEPNPALGSVWPFQVRQELLISSTNRSLRDFFDVATRETGRVVVDLEKVLYP